jgi:RNA polymerase sigma-B factor
LACRLLVTRYRWLVRSCVRPYLRSPEPAEDLMLQAREATWELAQELGRVPAESDLARHLGVSAGELGHARRAELALRPLSLDAPLVAESGSSTLADGLGEDDPRLEHMLRHARRRRALG